MDSLSYPQIRIVPLRMLEAENAEKFLDGLSYIAGIRRILVHGPGYHKSPLRPGDLDSWRVPVSTTVTISEQQVPLHVLMGDVVVEALDEKALFRIAGYCEEFFDDMPFQILSGKYLKTEPSLSDFLGDGPRSDPYDPFFIGLSDAGEKIYPSVIAPSYPDAANS